MLTRKNHLYVLLYQVNIKRLQHKQATQTIPRRFITLEIVVLSNEMLVKKSHGPAQRLSARSSVVVMVRLCLSITYYIPTSTILGVLVQ